ncbi:hypothetical protein SAMD00019534_064950 [Acytostelium subglobosum LB1]|uniref:hypothetical protein n=1 Tax=Acytostelium subglobosum LB1 TaxID=1410327 RepID=UPI000644D7E4|nr:hypothetical protein SAMD00019534_064950 [Acytostelium subglobosum LB1]GAM23320.1 hypothetical protein SAMD00019534_064950 [Acytostelium subglobosum LB1]|eukprot:XP_012753769.1 hypothetical protein SAMD00019534_064950 [Acytostelium subglobosum LB1]
MSSDDDDDELSDVNEDDYYYDPSDHAFEEEDDDDDDDDVEEDLLQRYNLVSGAVSLSDIIQAYMSRLRGGPIHVGTQQAPPQVDKPNQDLTDELITHEYQARVKHPDVRVNDFLMQREIYGFDRYQPVDLTSNYIPNTVHSKNITNLSSKIFSCKLMDCCRTFMTASSDCKIRFFNTSNWTVDKTVQAFNIQWSIIDTDISSNEKMMLYSSWSPYIYLVNLEDDESEQMPIDLSPGRGRFCLFSLKFSADNTQLLGGSSGGHIYLYDLVEGKKTHEVYGHSDDTNSVCWIDDNVFASGSDDFYIKIWDKRTLHNSQQQQHATGNYDDTCRPEGFLTGHRRGLTHVESKGDGRYLLSNGKDCRAKLWDIRTMSTNINQIYTDRSESYQDLDYRLRGTSTTSGPTRNERDLSLVTYANHPVFQTLIRCHFSPVQTTAQKYIYSGSSNGEVFIYNTLSGELVQRLHHGRGPIRDVSWSQCSPELISTSWEGYITQWSDWIDGRPSSSTSEDDDDHSEQ